MNLDKKIRIGTRKSLLALTQSGQVKNALEENSSAKFELVSMKTLGDMILDKPLSEVPGKEFFTKEIDDALLADGVDLVVNSFKDLSLTRPKEMHLAAITKRSLPHDLLFIRKDVVSKLHELDSLTVGTSSPRRIYFSPKVLPKLLPHFKGEIKTKNLRGNVNTRLEKLNRGEYDAIVLAFAGVERLAKSPDTHSELKPLLQNLNLMVLPLSSWPSAPAQGALAVECKKSNQELVSIIEKIHCTKTKEEISLERSLFASHGGGCHQEIGIFSKKIGNELFTIMKGRSGEQTLDELLISPKRARPIYKKVFIGKREESAHFLHDQLISTKKIEALNIKASALYFTSPSTLHVKPEIDSLIFTSGRVTMERLVSLGHFVTATSDSFGDEHIKEILESSLFFLQFGKIDLTVLTSLEGTSSIGKVHGVYKREVANATMAFENELKECDLFFWMSGHQFEHYTSLYPWIKEKSHATGFGKTFKALEEKGINVIPYFSYQHFLNEIQKDT